MVAKVCEPHTVDLDSPFAREVLTSVQSALPIDAHPYAVLGETCGGDEVSAFAVVETARKAGIIRRIGASFDSYKLGYVSSLAALAVPHERLENVAEIVSAHSSVTHNYERDDRYNLWFTCIAHGHNALARELSDIQCETGIDDMLVLPALRLFKVRVAFDVRNEVSRLDVASQVSDVPDCIVPAKVAPLDSDNIDRALVRVLQGDLAGDIQPFALVALRVSRQIECPMAEFEVLDRVRMLMEKRAIRRFGAMVYHRKMGFSCNAMAVWNIPDHQVEQAGAILARPAHVSHCYERPRRAAWPWNLYTMIHGHDCAECECVAEDLRKQLVVAGIKADLPRMLVSTREFKKTSMHYFEEE